MPRPSRVLRPACLAAIAVLAAAPGFLAGPASADATDGTLTVTVVLDLDANGRYEPENDRVQPGVTVTVVDAGGGTVTGATDADGRFVVEPTSKLAGGRYFVTAEVPDGLGVVPAGPSDSFAPSSSTVDVSAGSQSVTVAVVTPSPVQPMAEGPVPPSPQEPEVPAPAARREAEGEPRFAVGDRVWWDADGDGRQGEGERGRGGVSVQLLDPAGSLLASTTSDPEGRYLFDDLPAGTYAVRFAGLGSGLKLSPSGAGGRGGDSNPDYTGLTPSFTLDPGEPDVLPTEPRDGVRAAYLDATVDAGVAPLSFAIDSMVWQDLDADGLLDQGEPPGSARVVLLSRGEVVATTTTDKQGRYRFGALPRGSYQVRFSELGEHRVLTRPHVGSNRALDSAADPATATTAVYRLAQGTADLVPGAELGNRDDFVLTTANAGTVGSYRITNRVWRDQDGDGVLDPGEPGVGGVVVELLDAAGEVVRTARTAPDGRFTFDRLPSGQYRLRFADLPPGLHFTTPQVGADPTADSDVYGDALTAPVTLGADNPVEAGVAAGLTTSIAASAEASAPAAALSSPAAPSEAASPPPAPAAAVVGREVSPVVLGLFGLVVAAGGACAVLVYRLRDR